MEKACTVCGVIFSKKVNVSKKNWARSQYCSRKCCLSKTIITSQKNFGLHPEDFEPWNKGLKYNERMKARLNVSGLEIGRGFNKGKKFPERSGENSPTWKPKTTKTCKGCSKTLSLAPWESDRLFCNVTCYGLWHRGENSPVFMGEKAKSLLRHRIMELPEYVAWRKAIFARDNFTCVICSKRGGDLEADHFPEAYWEIRDRLGITSAQDARDCKDFWDISSGRTLCLECHRKTDNYMKKPKKPNSKRK